MVEVWKPIQGFDGLYEISNLGNVKSLNYCNHGYSQNLVPKINNKGYLWVELWKDGKRHCMQVHRLVAMHFIINNNPLRTDINHIDENPQNNVVTNLEWCTKKENMVAYMNNHPERRRRERFKSTPKYKSHMAQKIIQLSTNGLEIAIHPNVSTIGRTLGYHSTSILECCTGKRKTAYGYKWQFAN